MKTEKIFNFLTFPFVYLLSVLPFPILYLFSDLLFVMLYFIWGYRKETVYNNLKASFPDKTDKQLKSLRWFYYRYLCDLFLETFKMLTISSKEMLKRCSLDDQSRALLDKLYFEKESAILTLGHKGNWEWAGNAFSLVCRQPFYIVYHPLSNSGFDKMMYQMRSRFGARLMTMSSAFKVLKQVSQEKEPVLSAFVADQSPPPTSALWTEFLHQETPFFRGPEKISGKLGQSVLYLSIHRVRRGYYTMHVESLASSHQKHSDGEITEKYVKVLEQDILSEPTTWLWSHRRWKHKHEALAS